jgi:hypothetical protein
MTSEICESALNVKNPEKAAIFRSGAAKRNIIPAKIFTKFLPDITEYNPNPNNITDTAMK